MYRYRARFCLAGTVLVINILLLFGTTPGVSGQAVSVPPSPKNPEAKPLAGWKRREVNWRLPGGMRVRSLHEPAQAPVPTTDRSGPAHPRRVTKRVTAGELPPKIGSGMATAGPLAAAPQTVSASLIHAPPLDGFSVWVAILATDAHKTNGEWDAPAETTVQGNYLVPDPQTQYGIGLYDSGASISVMGNANAEQLGLFSHGLNTGGTIAIGGVTGGVDAWVSQPFGLWIAGLDSIDPSTLALNTSSLVGEWNVSIAMGQTPAPGSPDMATAIGAPMAVYFAASIRNDIWPTVTSGGTTYEGPSLTLYDPNDPGIPEYASSVPLVLRPAGAYAVWYWPCFSALEYCPGGDDSPKTPSLIMGNSMQSLFFVGGVNLGNRGHTVNNASKFMLDTGAQVSVVSIIIGSQLGLSAAHRQFSVEIEGLDGTVMYAPGFFVDALDIPTTDVWLSYTQVPVVMLDIDSPEGGTLDGIIGMNLFTRYNLVLRGGGLPGMGNPFLDVDPLPSINVDFDGDGDVDMDDFAHLQRCCTGAGIELSDEDCYDTLLDGDYDVDNHEILWFIQCASGPAIPAAPDCRGQ